MLEAISAEYIGGGLLLLTAYLISLFRPIGQRSLSSWRQRYGRSVAAACAAIWRKALIALVMAWSAGGVLAYGLTGGMDDAAPLWAICWLGSVSVSLWGCAGCWAVRWAVSQTRQMVV